MIHRVDGKEAWERASGRGQDFERQAGTNPKASLESRDFTLDSKGPIVEAEEGGGCFTYQKDHPGLVNAAQKRWE